MRLFFAVVHKDPGSAYGLSFPDLPGCFSAADEFGDILRMATEALDFWFEDQPMVTPRSAEDWQAELAEELRDYGGMLVGIPYVPEAERRAA